MERQIKGYLKNYYGVGNTRQIGEDVYFYFYGEIAVKATGWLNVTDLKQVIDRLLW